MRNICRVYITLALLCCSLQSFATTYIYDELNRLTTVTYDNGGIISYNYDSSGNITAHQITAPSLVAHFTATPTTGSSPLSIDFTDQSQGNVTSWAWDFGDGTTSTIQNPSHTYQHAGTFTVTLTINGMQTATKTNYISALPVLTVVLAGTGGGSVNSNPPGIHCETPPLTGPCATTYTLSDVVKLMAARNSDSLFTGWSDACTGGGDCSVTLSDSKKATATFTYVTQVRIPRNPVAEFSSIQNAYNTVLTGEEIQARAVSVIENLFFSNSIKVILKGGFDINYKNQGGYTIVQGKVTVGKGSLVVDRVIIR